MGTFRLGRDSQCLGQGRDCAGEEARKDNTIRNLVEDSLQSLCSTHLYRCRGTVGDCLKEHVYTLVDDGLRSHFVKNRLTARCRTQSLNNSGNTVKRCNLHFSLRLVVGILYRHRPSEQAEKDKEL